MQPIQFHPPLFPFLCSSLSCCCLPVSQDPGRPLPPPHPPLPHPWFLANTQHWGYLERPTRLLLPLRPTLPAQHNSCTTLSHLSLGQPPLTSAWPANLKLHHISDPPPSPATVADLLKSKSLPCSPLTASLPGCHIDFLYQKGTVPPVLASPPSLEFLQTTH